MLEKKLKKKLKSDPRFIPFNEKFDYKYVLQYLRNNNNSKNVTETQLKAFNSIFFNPYFNDLKSYFLEVIEKNKISSRFFKEIIITLANRDLYLISLRTMDSIKDSPEFHYDKMINSTLKSHIPEMGEFNAQAGLEASHDGLNTIINLIIGLNDNSNNAELTTDILDNCAKILGFSNIYAVIKSAYDIAIWEDYDIHYNTEKSVLKIKCQNINHQLLNRVGEYRLERNIFASKQYLISSYLNKDEFYSYLTKESNKKRKPKRLKKILIINNELKYKLGNGIEKNSVLKEALSFAELTTYYAFIKNESLPNLDNLNLYDILVVFSEVQYLFHKAFEYKKNEDSDNITSFNAYRLFINKIDLIEYVFLKTNYSKKQINQTIDLFIHKNGYSNIWERPLIELNKKLFPVFLPLLNPNSLRLIDYWLEKGGFDIDERGNMFENHIKAELEYELNRKGFFNKIIKENIFRNNSGKFEEIDLILELKSVIIIAEIKCIKYPFDPRDYHNTHNRLKEGVEQIKRKTDFLINFQNEFNINLSKKIINVVITNYPIFSGYKIDDVPISDFSLLENYFINGAMGKGQIAFNKGKLDIRENHPSIVYYKNENEFCNNLNSFLLDPIPIKEKINDFYLEETQISLPDSKPKIIMDYINSKETNLI